MSGELYQLVALDKNGKEHVIELNNDNKNDKGLLSFIDSGTTYMKNEQTLINYLIRKGKLNDPNVTFVIKYNNRGVRYLPVIYNEPGLRQIALKCNDENLLRSYAKYFVDLIENDLCNYNFYNYIVELNEEIFSQVSNGSYLDDKVLDEFRKFYEAYGIARDDLVLKEQYKHKLATKLNSYKKIRTIYIYYKMYLDSKLNKGNNYDIPDMLKYLLPQENVEFNPDIPEELKKAYEQNGMDGVWTVTDLDDIEDKGYKFR